MVSFRPSVPSIPCFGMAISEDTQTTLRILQSKENDEQYARKLLGDLKFLSKTKVVRDVDSLDVLNTTLNKLAALQDRVGQERFKELFPEDPSPGWTAKDKFMQSLKPEQAKALLQAYADKQKYPAPLRRSLEEDLLGIVRYGELPSPKIPALKERLKTWFDHVLRGV